MISRTDNSKLTKLIWRHENNIAHGSEAESNRFRGSTVPKAPNPICFKGLQDNSTQIARHINNNYNRESSQTNSNLQSSFEGSLICFGSASGAIIAGGKAAKDCLGKQSFTEKIHCFLKIIKKPFKTKDIVATPKSLREDLIFINQYLEKDNVVRVTLNKALADISSETAQNDRELGQVYINVNKKINDNKIIIDPSIQGRIREIITTPYQFIKNAVHSLSLSETDKILKAKQKGLEQDLIVIAQAREVLTKKREEELEKLAHLSMSQKEKDALVDEKLRQYLKNVSFDSFRKIITGYGSNASLTANRIISGSITSAFLAADAYNLTRYLTDDDNKSKNEARIRFKQEMGRVALTAYLTYAVSTLFKEACNASLKFALLAGFSVLLVSEVYGRKFAGKPVLPISKERADKYNRDRNNPEENISVEDKVMMAAKGLLGMEKPLKHKSNDVFIKKSQNDNLNQFIKNAAAKTSQKGNNGGLL